MTEETKRAMDLINEFDFVMDDARSIIGSVKSALYSEAVPVRRRHAAEALGVADTTLKRAQKSGWALWEITKQQKVPQPAHPPHGWPGSGRAFRLMGAMFTKNYP